MMEIDAGQSAFMAGAVARLALSFILAHSATEAIRDWDIHAAIVAQYRLLPEWLVPPAARILPILNLIAALLLLAPGTAALGAVLGLGLMAVFTGAVAINLWRGRDHIACGCGGAAGQRLSVGLVLRNLALVAMLLLVLAVPVGGLVDAGFVVGVLGGGLALVAFYFAVNQLLTNSQALKTLTSGR